LSFKENNPKEELVLEHVITWQTQFAEIYSPYRPLLLAPRNECGVLKFICTTIRPTKLPYKELYSWNTCSKFLANFLEYEELDPPDQLPSIVPAPSNTLAWQTGDCFDFSILMCSLLIGNGYDCFVVYGKAPKEITSRDESMMSCPIPDLPEFPSDEQEEIKPLKKVKKPVVNPEELAHHIDEPLSSKFDEMVKQKAKEERELKARIDMEITDDEPEYERPDPYRGRRLHCWILVKRGKRDIKEDFFIEPTTGRHYSIKDCPYISIEAIFNNQNFWVNMRPELSIDKVGIDEFDMKENCEKEWEYVMLPLVHKRKRQVEEGNGEPEIYEEEETNEDILDMPTPWSPKLIINKESEELGTAPKKTVFYLKSKVDFYGAYTQPDGLHLRITFYKDYKRQLINEIRSYFSYRADKLLLRRRFPYEFKTIEEYLPGRKTGSGLESHLKRLVQIDGKLRQLYFYPHRNKDGLIYREEQILNKTIEMYKSRPDRLIYRSITFDPNKVSDSKDTTFNEMHSGTIVVINKMTQKYALDPTNPPEVQHSKVVINYRTRKLIEYFHYSENSVKQIIREHNLESLRTTDANEKDSEKTSEEILKQKLGKIIKDCINDIQAQEYVAKNEMTDIQQGDVYERSIFYKARERGKREKKEQEEEGKKEEEDDYLAPVFAKLQLEKEFRDYKKGMPLTVEQAKIVQNEAFQMHKERIKARAKIIQDRLDAEVKELQSQFNETTSNPETMTRDKKDDYQKKYSEINLKISILTERAYQQYQYALEKFKKIEEKMAQDPRFEILRQSQI